MEGETQYVPFSIQIVPYSHMISLNMKLNSQQLNSVIVQYEYTPYSRATYQQYTVLVFFTDNNAISSRKMNGVKKGK